MQMNRQGVADCALYVGFYCFYRGTLCHAVLVFAGLRYCSSTCLLIVNAMNIDIWKVFFFKNNSTLGGRLVMLSRLVCLASPEVQLPSQCSRPGGL